MVLINFNVPTEVLRAIRREAEQEGSDISKVARKHLLKGMEVNVREKNEKAHADEINISIAKFFGQNLEKHKEGCTGEHFFKGGLRHCVMG